MIGVWHPQVMAAVKHTPKSICIKHSDPSASHTHGGRAAAKIVFDTNRIRGVVQPVHIHQGGKQEGRGSTADCEFTQVLRRHPQSHLTLLSLHIPDPFIYIQVGNTREGINSGLQVHSIHEATSTKPPNTPPLIFQTRSCPSRQQEGRDCKFTQFMRQHLQSHLTLLPAYSRPIHVRVGNKREGINSGLQVHSTREATSTKSPNTPPCIFQTRPRPSRQQEGRDQQWIASSLNS
jgi:hypothetical protein